MNTRNIVITGASSGIGHALALEYAAPGVVLALFGRDAARLEICAQACRAKGARAEIFATDVMDRAAMAAGLRDFDARNSVDLVIANAGISSGSLPGGGNETSDAALKVIQVNVLGTLHTILPLLPAMRARGRGQIAIMGSLAARPGLPSSPAYSASKAAVETYGSALAGAVADDGVRVSVISPGFVTSPMSDRVTGPRPFLMSAPRAAGIIRQGLDRGRAHIRFPWPLALAAGFAALLPQGLRHAFLKPLAFRIDPD